MKALIKLIFKVKTCLLLMVLCLLANGLFAQTSWKGTVSSSWTKSENWTNGVPTATVDVIIGDENFSGAYQPNVSPSSKCKSLTIGNDTKVSTLTVSKSLIVSGSITIGANGTILHSNSSISLTGNWSKTGTYTASGNNSTVIFTGTSQSITGASTFRKLTINSGSTTSLNNAITISKAFSVNGSFDPSTHLVTLSGASFTVNASATILVKAATFSANYSVNPSLNELSTVNYASSAINQTIAALSYGNLHISGGLVKTLAANTTLLSSTATVGNVTVTACTLDLSIYTLNRGTSSIGGSFSLSNGATLKIKGTNTYPTNYNTNNLATTSTVEYSGTNQTISNRAYGNLTLSSNSGAATKTMPNTAMFVANDFTSSVGLGTSVSYTALANIIVNGNVNIGASTTFSGGAFSHTFAGNFANSGTFTGSTSTVTFSGGNKSISGSGTSSFNNVTITGLGVTASASSISVSGNFVTSGPGTFVHNTGGTITMSGTSKTISGLDITFENLTVSGSISTASSLSIAGNLSVEGSLDATDGTIQMTGTSKTLGGAGSISFYAFRVNGIISTAISFSMKSDMSGLGKLSASAGTANFIGSSSFDGTHDFYNVTLNGTYLQLGTNSVMGIANAFTLTLGSFDVTTSVPNTVDFNGTGAQNVTATSYNNLSLSISGTKTAAAALVVKNDLNINAGATFNASSFTHTVEGNWMNSGTFTAATSTVQFMGALNSTITGATTFNNATLNKDASDNFVTLNNDMNVATLNMTTGELRTESNSVIISNTRTGNGIILGTITRNHSFLSSTAYAFESPYNTITFNTLDPGTVTSVSVTVTSASVDAFPLSGSINRDYVISASPSGVYEATLRLHYEDSELNGNVESTMELWRYNTSWAKIGKSGNDATNNHVEMDGLTDLNDSWTISDNSTIAIWKGDTSSDWATASNWKSGLIPSSNDIIEIGTESFTNQPSISSSVTAKAIVFGSVQASLLTIGASGALAIDGNVRGDWAADAAHTISIGAQTMLVNGDLVLSNGNSNRAINLNISSGTLTVVGSITQSGGANVTFEGLGNLNIGGNFNYSGGTFIADSGTVTYNGVSSQTVAGGITYYNLATNKASGTASLFSSVTLNGNFTLSTGGTFNMGAAMTVVGDVNIGTGTTVNANASNFYVGGSWTRNGVFSSSLGTVIFNGTGAQSVSTTTFNGLTINKSAGTLSPTGNLIINGNLTITSGTLDLASFTANRSVVGGTLTMGAGSFLKLSGASNFPNNFNVKTFSSTSTVEYNGSVAQEVCPHTYGHLAIKGGGATAKVLTGSTSVGGNFTINSDASLDGGIYTLTLMGDFLNSGTFIPSTGTVVLAGTNKTIQGATSFNNFIVPGIYTSSPNTHLTIDGLTDCSGSYTAGVNNFTVSGDVIVSGAFSGDGITTYTGTKLQTLRLVGTMTSPLMSSKTIFAGTIAPVLNSSSTPTFVHVDITNTGAGGIVSSVNWVVVGTFTVANDATFNGSNLSHTFYGSFINNGTVLSSGTLNLSPIPPYTAAAATTIYLGSGAAFQSTGNVIFGGTRAVTIDGTPSTFNNVTISNSNIAGISPAADWTVLGDFNVSSGAIFNAGTAFSHTFKSDMTIAGTFNGNTSTTIIDPLDSVLVGGSGSVTFNNLTLVGQVSTDINFNISGDFTDNGIFSVNGADISFVGNTNAIIGGSSTPIAFETLVIDKESSSVVTLGANVEGITSLTISSGTFNLEGYAVLEESVEGGLLTLNAASKLKIGASNTLPVFTNGYLIDSTSTIEYGGSNQIIAQQVYGNLILSGSGTKTFLAGTTSIKGSLTKGGSASGDAITNSTLIHFNGSSTQSVASLTYYNIVVDNSNGVSLLGNLTVSNNLNLAKGKLLTNVYKVILQTTASVSGEANGRYVVGNLEITQVVGTGASIFGGMGLTMDSGVEDLGNVTVLRSAGPGSAAVVGVAENQGINRRWDINITGAQPTSGRLVTFSWIADDDNDKDLSSLQLYSRETSADAWEAQTFSTDVSSRSYQYNTTHFSEWTVSDENNTLPITLISFKGTRTDAYTIDLEWVTGTEFNNSGFEIKKSRDGENFSNIAFVEGKGNSVENQKYNFADYQGANTFYYRLKQVDLDGKFTYSSIIRVVSNVAQFINVYPNPVEDKIAIAADDDLMTDTEVKLAIISDKGQNLIEQSGTLEHLMIYLNQNLHYLNAGTYYFSLTTPDRNYVKRIIKL